MARAAQVKDRKRGERQPATIAASVGEAKRIRERIEGLQARVDEHREKITEEVAKPNPDMGWINHWQREIRVWQRDIDNLQARLRRRRRRGS